MTSSTSVCDHCARRLKRCDRPELSLIVSGILATVEAGESDQQRVTTLVDMVEFLADSHPDLAISLCTAVLAKDPIYQEIKNKTPLLSNRRLARRVNQLVGNSSVLKEIYERESLVGRLGELLAVN